VRQYLVEEKLITPYQARHHAQVFRGYSEYYEFEDYTVDNTAPSDDDSIF
jgi:hypothetical protein